MRGKFCKKECNCGRHRSKSVKVCKSQGRSQAGENNHFFGKKHTKDSNLKNSLAHRGEKSYRWKCGISVLNNQIRNSLKYKEWLKLCLKRDNYTCQNSDCLKKGIKFQVHHKKSFALILRENNIKTLEDALNCKELWNMDNGQTLCIECHKKTDNYKSKLTISK